MSFERDKFRITYSYPVHAMKKFPKVTLYLVLAFFAGAVSAAAYRDLPKKEVLLKYFEQAHEQDQAY